MGSVFDFSPDTENNVPTSQSALCQFQLGYESVASSDEHPCIGVDIEGQSVPAMEETDTESQSPKKLYPIEGKVGYGAISEQKPPLCDLPASNQLEDKSEPVHNDDRDGQGGEELVKSSNEVSLCLQKDSAISSRDLHKEDEKKSIKADKVQSSSIIDLVSWYFRILANNSVSLFGFKE